MAAPNKTENLSATNDHWNKLNASTHTQRLKKLRSSQNYDEKTWQLENQLRNVNSRPELAVEAFRDDCQFSSSGKIKTTIFFTENAEISTNRRYETFKLHTKPSFIQITLIYGLQYRSQSVNSTSISNSNSNSHKNK